MVTFLIQLVYKTVKAGFKTTEVPFMFVERETGESKMALSVAFESLWLVCRLFVQGRLKVPSSAKRTR